MPLEIERRFLVEQDIRQLCRDGVEIIQGYVPGDSGGSVRIRIAGDLAFLTVKGPRRGCVRTEHESALPMLIARRMLSRLPHHLLIRKTRYHVAHAEAIWHVDHFHGANAGLVIAEIELDAADQPVILPPWVGREITEESRYGNSRLSRTPISAWRVAA